MDDSTVTRAIEAAYETFEGDERLEEYMQRHDVRSLGVLTVTDDETAAMIADYLAPKIAGKVVVEIGAGIGLLACHMARHAFKVYAIEASPLWASCFVVGMLERKPKNCTFILGAASEMEGVLRADVAVYCTHSAANAMREAGALFAPVVVDVYADLLGPGTTEQQREWIAHRTDERRRHAKRHGRK